MLDLLLIGLLLAVHCAMSGYLRWCARSERAIDATTSAADVSARAAELRP